MQERKTLRLGLALRLAMATLSLGAVPALAVENLLPRRKKSGRRPPLCIFGVCAGKSGARGERERESF